MKIYPPWVTNNVKHVRCNLNYERNIHKTSGENNSFGLVDTLIPLVVFFSYFLQILETIHQLAKCQVKVHMLPKRKTRTLVFCVHTVHKLQYTHNPVETSEYIDILV